MARTRQQRIRDGWIGVVALFAAGLVMRVLGFDAFGSVLVVTAIFMGVGVLTLGLGTGTGNIEETADETAARTKQRDDATDKFADFEQRIAGLTGDGKRKQQLQLNYDYLNAYTKSSTQLECGLEDGNFDLLAKRRMLLKEMLVVTTSGKWVANDIKRIDRSVEKWRKRAIDIKNKNLEVGYLDVDEYLARLNRAFPERSSPNTLPTSFS